MACHGGTPRIQTPRRESLLRPLRISRRGSGRGSEPPKPGTAGPTAVLDAIIPAPSLLSWESSNGPLTLVAPLRRVVLRKKDQGRLPGEPPVRLGVRRSRPAAAVPRVLARPPHRPPLAAGR